MRFKRWFPYFSVVMPWMIVGMPVGLIIPIFVLDIPLLDVPLYHKVVDAVVLLAASSVLGMVFAAIDVKLGHVGALRRCYSKKERRSES